ncbi:hypothetical protein H0H81_010521 [Sphagnurus paluster]|uniref:FAD-binding PCMH-type domain-containing protein n=1 Tax=Sphagnurus paluster TaxID=117069 RepID=A0A9P7K2J2_9AGAR|nr:hypothetical protein H0H81_010521 [Sphagnurus paluster]
MPPLAPLKDDLYEELGAACRGEVYQRGKPGFDDYSTIFNGNVKCMAKAVIVPLDAEDVSKVILFCVKHNLSPSVKAGGFGTAGWAIGGDIIIDLSKLVEVDIEPPRPDGSFTGLKHAAPENKGKDTGNAATSGKRRREDDAELRRYDQASRAVDTFLHSPERTSEDGPSPLVRRRIDNGSSSGASDRPATRISSTSTHTPAPAVESRQISIESDTISASNASEESSEGSRTISTGPATPSSIVTTNGSTSDSRPSCANRPADPFGYLNGGPGPVAAPVGATQSAYAPSSMLRSWAPGTGNLLFGYQNLPPGQMALAEPIHPHAFVTFGAGMRQKEIDTFTAQHKLEARYTNGNIEMIPYHIPFAAHPVGSSIMLLAGFGFLSRMHGLSIDNLVEVEMVLADGRIVIVNEKEHQDLWWALRGAGPCLGVATRYKAKAFPVPVVFAGNLIYRFNRATSPSLIKHFRDCVKGAPRELYVNLFLTAGPAGKDSLVVIQMCYLGSREKGQEYLALISSWDGERCLLNEIDEKSFLHQQDSVAQVLRGKAGRQWFIRSALITSLPDNIINETVLQFADTPVGCTWLFELAGGAVADFEDTCIPKSQREATFTVAALHQWELGAADDRCISSAEDWIGKTLKPVHQGGPFPTFLGRHELPERTKACYGVNWDRLCEVKKKYDPKNLFRHNFWPLNAEGETVDVRMHDPPAA